MRSARFFSSGRVTAAAADEGRAARGAGRPATAEDHVVRHFHAYDAADEAEASSDDIIVFFAMKDLY